MVGPGVANHHMSAHGVLAHPPMDGWTDWPARGEREREIRALSSRQGGRREKRIKKELATPAACRRPALSFSPSLPPSFSSLSSGLAEQQEQPLLHHISAATTCVIAAAQILISNNNKVLVHGARRRRGAAHHKPRRFRWRRRAGRRAESDPSIRHPCGICY